MTTTTAATTPRTRTGCVANTKGSGLAKTEYDFSKTQPWVNTTRSLTFLDETPELISIYDPDADQGSVPVPGLQVPPPGAAERSEEGSASTPFVTGSLPESSQGFDYASLQSHSGSNPHDHTSPSKRRRLTFSNSYQSSSVVSPGTFYPSPGNFNDPSPARSWHTPLATGWTPSSFDDGTRQHDASTVDSVDAVDAAFAALAPTTSHVSQASAYQAVPQPLSRIYLETPVWPLADKEQARLLRYYVEVLAKNFDLTDPLRHFTTVVPQRAATCPTLLNAIFALSAKHLSRIGEYDSYISDRFHQECLKHLIPMLDDTAAILDENLLASTIILRHLEEIEVPLSGQLHTDSQSHLLGAHAFITAQERAAITGGLRQSAFWVGLRQEIYVAFVNQRSIIPALEHCNIDRSCEAADDYVWACRIVVLCADVIRFCFGDGDRSVATYSYLTDSCAQWYACKPTSFTPVYWKAANERNMFPESMFLADHLCIGVQHWHIARILLSAHNPRVPRLGPGRVTALRAVDDEIKEHVRVLCGIALSNPLTPPNFVYASMAVTMAGDKFDQRHEQEALADVLKETERHAWPTRGAINNLRDAWGWTLSPESVRT